MLRIVLLVVSLLVPSHIHGASASASSVLGKRNAAEFDNVPGLDSEADVKMKDVGEDNNNAAKKLKRDFATAAETSAATNSACTSANATAMETDIEEVAHELPARNDEARFLQLYNHYGDYCRSPYNDDFARNKLGRALYALRTAIEDGENIDTVSSSDATVLHCAIAGEHREFIKLLLNKGANVHAPLHEDGSTPLHWAVGGVFFDPRLEEAPVYGLEESTLSLFGNRGIDFNRRDRNGLTPLLAALAYWGRSHHVRFLLSQGAHATTTVNGHGALWMLFNCHKRYRYHRHHDFLEITQLLVKAGVDFQIPSPEGRSPLYNAWALRNKTSSYDLTRENIGKVISWLIGIGAKIVVPNNEIFSIRDLLYARIPSDDPIENMFYEEDTNQPMDQAAEKLHAAAWTVVPHLYGTPLQKQPNFTHWHKVVTCGDLIHSYFLSHPLIEEGYRQRELFNQLQTQRLTVITSDLDGHGLRDAAALIHHLAGPLIVEHYPEADAKRNHAAQIVPMEEGE